MLTSTKKKIIKFPETIKVDLIPADFIDNRYINTLDCPLARAVKRHLKLGKGYDAIVGQCDVDIEFGREKLAIYDNVDFEEWNDMVYERVRECYANGDKTIYFVTLYKKD